MVLVSWFKAILLGFQVDIAELLPLGDRDQKRSAWDETSQVCPTACLDGAALAARAGRRKNLEPYLVTTELRSLPLWLKWFWISVSFLPAHVRHIFRWWLRKQYLAIYRPAATRIVAVVLSWSWEDDFQLDFPELSYFIFFSGFCRMVTAYLFG